MFKSAAAGEIADQATAETEATWDTLINSATAGRMYVIKALKNVEWDNEETPMVEGNTKRRKKSRAGHRRVIGEVWDLTRQEVADYKLFDGGTLYVFDVTENGDVLGASSDGTKYTPMKVKFHIDNEMPPNGVDELWRLQVHVDYLEPSSAWEKQFNPSDLSASAWKAKDKDGILDVFFTEVSAASGSVVIDINGLIDNREVDVDFVAADFTSTIGAITSVSHVGNVYTLTPTTTFATGTLQFAGQPAMTTTGYETRTALSITI